MSQVAAAAPAQASRDGELSQQARQGVIGSASPATATWFRDVAAGRTSFSAIKDDDLPENLRALKPEQRMDELNKQMKQRKALNEKLAAW